MTQPLILSTEMDAASFRKFALFDLLHHKKVWHRPLLFTVLMLIFAGICLSQVGTRQGAGLLAGVLAVIGVGLPAIWFGNYLRSLSAQIKKMNLPRYFYRLQLSETGLDVWMAGEQDKPAPSHSYPWQTLHVVYRTPDAIYLYVQPGLAYLVSTDLDAAWAFLTQKLPAARLRDFRRA